MKMGEFQTVYDVLKMRAAYAGRKPALGVLKFSGQTFDDFHYFNWAEVFEKVQKYSRFLGSLSLNRGDRIALLGRNSAEWILLDWAALATGFVTVPLYAGSHLDEIDYILKESECKYLFVDSYIADIGIPQMSFDDLTPATLRVTREWAPNPLGPDEICSIIYTSGTTGNPKGVLHTSRNFFEAVSVANEVLRLSSRDQMLSYLPLSHVAERVLIEFGCLYTGARVAIIDRVEKLIQNLPKIRPSVFFAVPRVWDAIRNKVEKEMRSNALLTERLDRIPFFLRRFILTRFIRKRLGLDRARYCVSGAAKLSEDTWVGLDQLGIKVHEGYGLTETLCVSALNHQGKPVRGSAGKIYKQVQAKIAEDGELCLKAPFHFKGYYKHPEWTDEVLKDGWFHTGDVGRIDADGSLRITDRKKDIFKSSNGKYVAPVPIEILLKQHPAIREAVVMGENRPHCIAVAAVENEADEKSIHQHLEFVNSKLPSHEQIKSLGLLRKTWSANSGELTPSLKVKRRAVLEIYHQEIKELYETGSRVKLF